jgi:hypothetical protein
MKKRIVLSIVIAVLLGGCGELFGLVADDTPDNGIGTSPFAPDAGPDAGDEVE